MPEILSRASIVLKKWILARKRGNDSPKNICTISRSSITKEFISKESFSKNLPFPLFAKEGHYLYQEVQHEMGCGKIRFGKGSAG